MRPLEAVLLEPGDEIEIDGNWWTVTACSLDHSDPAPVTIQLLSEDREFLSAVVTGPAMQFNCRTVR